MARSGTPRVLLAFATSVVCGWWAAGLEPFSAHATSAVLAAGVAAMVAGGARREPASAQNVSVGAVAPWVVLVGLLMAWQLAAYVQHPRSDHPTLSSLTNAALDPQPIRALAFAAWMFAAGWLAKR